MSGGAETAAREACAALVSALERRDPALHGHAREVAVLSREVAREIGLSRTERDAIARAGWLHDIGKVVLPDSILLKPGPLDPHEAARMRSHTILGEEIVRAAPALSAVADIVRSSHERFDGRGYPDGLAGDAIPLGARIVAACDAYSAMCQDRPYGRVLGAADAVAELYACAGTQFDPVVVDAFRAVSR